MYQMKCHFEGFPKLVNYHSCWFQRRRKMLSNVQIHYRKVTKERSWNPEIFVKIIFPAFFEPVSVALLLLETAVIALIWVMNQLKAFLTPLLATVLQLKEQFNHPSELNISSTKFYTMLTEVLMSNNINLQKGWFLLTSFQIFFFLNRILQ